MTKIQSSKVGVWLIVLGFAVVSAVAAFTGGNVPFAIGGLLGASLFLVILAILLTKFSKQSAVYASGILIFAFSVYQGTTDYFEGERTRLARAELANMQKILLETGDLQARQYSSEQYGDDWAALLNALNETLVEDARITRVYSTRLEEIGIPEVFRPESYESSEFTEQAGSQCKAMRQAISETRTESQNRLSRLRQQFSDLNISPRLKAGVLRGFDGEMVSRQEANDAFFEVQYSVVDLFEETLEFMGGRDLEVSEDEILFRTQQEADEYNALYSRLDEIAELEQEIIDISQQRRADRWERNKRALGGANN